jgi:hypothetical protein
MSTAFKPTTAEIVITSLTSSITGALSRGDRHIGNCYAYYQNKHILGDYISGKLYQMSETLFTDDGNPIYSTRISDVVFDGDTVDNVFLHKVFLDAEVGMGISGSTSAPECSLAISKDSGYTWSADYPASLGLLNARTTRLLWRRLGYGTTLTAKITMSSNSRKILVGAYGEVGL